MNLSKLDRIWKKIDKHSINENGDIVVVCLAINKNDGTIFTTRKNMIPPDPNKSKSKSHAETYVILELIRANKNIDDYFFITSFNPCNGCVRMLNKNGINELFVIVEKEFIAEEYLKKGFSHKILPIENEKQQEVYDKIAPLLRQFMKEEYN